MLIFVGITLAIGFENWNAERVERREEQATLRELRSNLVDNIAKLEDGLTFDSLTLFGIDTILAHLDARLPYSEGLSTAFAGLENFSSPYLTSSAYETLRVRGLELVSRPTLRAEIVHLFETEYRQLVEDHDRSEWINYEVSIYPLMLTRVEERPGEVAQPIDSDALLDDRLFRVALLRSASLRTAGIAMKKSVIEGTKQVIEGIDQHLGN